MDLTEFEERKKKFSERSESPLEQQQKQLENKLNQIKRRIAVWSGKGGVGKTTIAINLAWALAEKGKTGLLDADIDCPNVPLALGLEERLTAKEGMIQPLVSGKLQVVSMGAIIGKSAMLWRGPMISSAITEFVYKVEWDIDYLVLDMPPGSSDAALTIAQMLRPHGFVIVTTSNELGIMDARRSIKFAQKLKLNVYGIIENMSGEMFGSGGGKKLAKEFNLPFFGSLPLDKKIQRYLQERKPLHTTEFRDVFVNAMEAIAE